MLYSVFKQEMMMYGVVMATGSGNLVLLPVDMVYKMEKGQERALVKSIV